MLIALITGTLLGAALIALHELKRERREWEAFFTELDETLHKTKRQLSRERTTDRPTR